MDSLLIELIKVALGAQNKLSRVPNANDWEAIFEEAKRQSIIGVSLYGLERLPMEQLPSASLKLKWISISQVLDAEYRVHCLRVAELSKELKTLGINSCLLKGVGTAQLYPNPVYRQSGDIDLWLDGGREEVLTLLELKYEVDHKVWVHVDAKVFDDVKVEIHFHPSWLYRPIKNRRLQNWFDNQRSEQMKVDKELGFAHPKPEFDAVFSLVHTLHHLIEEGVGLRHIIDYFYILRALSFEKRAYVLKTIYSIGLGKFLSAMMWIMQEVCGMPAAELLCAPDEREGKFFLDEIMRGGNFGFHRKDKRRRNSISRFMAILPHYTAEMLWVYPWKVWHSCWRLFHR